MIEDLIFSMFAVVALAAAIGMIALKDLFRAALCLVIVFVSIAGIYVMLNAEFLAVIQVLVYVGAISILLIFAVMLSDDVKRANLSNRLQIPAILLCGVILAVLLVAVVSTQWNVISEVNRSLVDTVQIYSVNPEISNQDDDFSLASLLLTDHVLAFELVSVLLLAALIGALSLMRGNGEK
tara:strand:+ start:5799 stop:6341 length:543 start_codon:yes stop_codon:yes gene_type:complete